MDYFENNTKPMCGESQRDSLYVLIPITVIYLTIFVTGTIGNISTCIVIARNKVMHTATNYYLFSLAISDLVLLFSGLPQEIYFIWYRYPYIFGSTFCFLRGLLAETSGNATVLTITAFTVERYLAICHPFLSHTMSKLSRAIKLILVIWILAVGLAIPQAIPLKILGNEECSVCVVDMDEALDHVFEVSSLLFFMAPMTLITVLYILIGLRLKSSRMMKRKISTNARIQSKSSRKVVKMLVSVVVAFFICWAPFHIQRVYSAYHRDGSGSNETIYAIVTYVSGVLYYMATTVNPILYNIMSVKFREAFKETFSRCCGIGHLHHGRGPQRSYSVLSKSKVRCPDSTDSGSHDPTVQTNTSLAHKNSAESFNGSRGYKPQTSFKEHCGIQEEITPGNQKAIPIVELQSLSTVSSPSYPNNPTYLSVHVGNSNPTRLTRFLQFFHCIAKRTLDDSKRLSSYYSTPVKEPNILEMEKTAKISEKSKLSRCDSGVHKPCISNSSLKDIEMGAIEDELTAYMKEIRRRELIS